MNILGKYKKIINDGSFKTKSDFIHAINQSDYIKMLQKNGLLPIISNVTTIVIHFITSMGTRFSIVFKTSDQLSNILEIIRDKFPQLKDHEFFLLWNAMKLNTLDYSKTLEQIGLQDDDKILLISLDVLV